MTKQTSKAIECDLLRDGISITASLFDHGLVGIAARRALELQLKQDKIGAKRLFENADREREFEFFFHSDIFSDLFPRLLGEGAVSRRNRVQLRTDHGVNKSPILLFHIDSVAPRYKVFLHLSDVTDEDGPLEFLRKTHVGDWREPYCEEVREALANNATDAGIEPLDYNGCLKTDKELDWAKSRFELVRVLGSMGTCVVFDTRGFHRASPLNSGSRLLLSMDWMRREDNL